MPSTPTKVVSDSPKRPRIGGRQKGTPNKATADIKNLARVHTLEAMRELARLAVHATNESARVAAIKELFDRGYGKASQLVGSDPDNPLPTSIPVRFVNVVSEDDAG